MSTDPNNNPMPNSSIILYQTEDGRSRIEVRLENETVWLDAKLMAELFRRRNRNIGSISKKSLLRASCNRIQL